MGDSNYFNNIDLDSEKISNLLNEQNESNGKGQKNNENKNNDKQHPSIKSKKS